MSMVNEIPFPVDPCGLFMSPGYLFVETEYAEISIVPVVLGHNCTRADDCNTIIDSDALTGLEVRDGQGVSVWIDPFLWLTHNYPQV